MVFASQAAAIIETSRLYMKLKASEKLYRFSVDMAGDAIFFVDPETGKITDSNEMAQKLFKYTRAEFASMHIWELNPEPQMPIARRLWQETKKIGWGKLGEINYLARTTKPFPAPSMSLLFSLVIVLCFNGWFVISASRNAPLKNRALSSASLTAWTSQS